MGAPIRETIAERFARHLREEREGMIRASSGVGTRLLMAGLEYEDWYSGDDPATEFPQPNVEHQPAFSEPWENTLGDNAWDAADPYWIRIQEPGLYVAAISASATWDLDFAPSGYFGISTYCYADAWRSIPPGALPEGRDDPFAVGSWTGSFGPTYDQRIWDGQLGGSHGWSFAGPPLELEAADSVRVIYNFGEITPFGAGEGWFAGSFQGIFSLHRIGLLAP